MRAWLLILGLFLPATAAAQGIRLDYQVPRDTDCPDEEAFVDLIRARLAHAPFDDEAAPTLSIEVTATPLRAEIVWRDADGEVQGRRIIEGTSCASLIETVAVASSVAIEEMEALAPPREAPREAEPRVIVRVVERDPERPPALVPPPAPEAALPDPVFARLSVSAAIGAGPGPSPYADFSLGGGVRYRDLGVLLSIHYWDAFVGSLVGGGASLRMRLVRGRLAGCWMPPPLFLCAAASVGMLEGEPSNVLDARAGRALVGTGGALIGVFSMLERHIGLDVYAELAAFLPDVSFYIGTGDVIWTTVPFLAQLHVSFIIET